MCSIIENNISYHNNNYFDLKKSKISTSRKIKNILKPVLGRIFKTKKSRLTKRSSYIGATAGEENKSDLIFDFDLFDVCADMENFANEKLEKIHQNFKLIKEDPNEIEEDDPEEIFIYNENGRKMKISSKDEFFIPIHFARSLDGGTFYWTSMNKEIFQPYQIEWNFHDRWAQA